MPSAPSPATTCTASQWAHATRGPTRILRVCIGWCYRWTKINRLLHRHAVVRGNDLPFAASLHPDVSQAVMIFVRLSVVGSFLVVGPGHDSGISVHADFQF